MSEHLPYMIQSVDPAGNILETFARTSSFRLAKLAYREMCKERPSDIIWLSNKAMLIARSDRD